MSGLNYFSNRVNDTNISKRKVLFEKYPLFTKRLFTKRFRFSTNSDYGLPEYKYICGNCEYENFELFDHPSKCNNCGYHFR